MQTSGKQGFHGADVIREPKVNYQQTKNIKRNGRLAGLLLVGQQANIHRCSETQRKQAKKTQLPERWERLFFRCAELDARQGDKDIIILDNGNDFFTLTR